MTLLTLKVYIDESEGEGTLSLLVDETELRLYEEQIRLSEHRLRMALDTVEMGFWEQDLASGEIFRDVNWSRILELDSVDVQDHKKEWQGRIHPDDRDRVLAAYVSFIDDGSELLEVDYRIFKGAAESIWCKIASWCKTVMRSAVRLGSWGRCRTSLLVSVLRSI